MNAVQERFLELYHLKKYRALNPEESVNGVNVKDGLMTTIGD